MLADLQDTIVALSTATGPGGRAIVRLSGPDAFRIATARFTSDQPILPHQRRCHAGQVQLPEIAAPLPAELHVWPAPRTYTGQHLMELHTLSCPPLVELLVGDLLAAGARAAQPGELTLRAFLSGKMDLTQAEAVLAVIEAGSRSELKQALDQLAGNVTQPLHALREDLLNLLADVEAGLDFTEEDIHFVGAAELLQRLSKALALITLLGKQLDQRVLAGRPFRAVLAGRPNAGKSSLFNALTGATALVSPLPGTTRDYLVRTLELNGTRVELIDTAGWQTAPNWVAAQAQGLGRSQAEQADLVLLCVAAGEALTAAETDLLARSEPPGVGLATKCDLATPAGAFLPTSAVTGEGLDVLRQLLADRARNQRQPALAPSLSRCRDHVARCLTHLRQAHNTVLFQEPAELVAVELRGALDQLGEMVGAVYTDDLLDRIFSRFCIGK
jgi:tRNA modification GTPase